MERKKNLIYFPFADTATVDDVEGFLQEIALIRSVGKHRNIVGIIGHCTVVYSEMMLLTEYCSEGNLLNYLRYVKCLIQ